MVTRRCLGWTGVLALGTVWMVSAEADAESEASVFAERSRLVAQVEPSGEEDSEDEVDSGVEVSPPPAENPGTLVPSGAPPASETSLPALEERPDQYAIQGGDTLWDISARFWGDPYFWPKLWSYNPYIGNAHLIYPGNVLRMDSGSYVRPPSVALESQSIDLAQPKEQTAGKSPTEEIQETYEPTSTATAGQAVCSPHVPFLEHTGTIRVRSEGFLREQGFGPLGKIIKAPDRKLLFGDRDIVYLQFSRIADVQCGDIFTIYEPTRKKVAHPIYHRRVLGSLYRILGEVQIVDVNDFLATGRIIASYSEIGRGDLLTEQVPIYREVEIRSSPKELEGYIVEALNQENSTLATNNIVYIDRGEQDGVAAGDAFYVVRQGDGLEGLITHGRKDITLPYQIIGKVVVSFPGEFVSEAVVTEASDVIELGDHVATQVN